jgi:uncharacterized membrane protein (UPF0127 family)
MPSKSNIKNNIKKNIKHKKPHLLYLTLLFFIVCVILFTNSNSNVHSKSNYKNLQHFNNTSTNTSTNTSKNNITITLELVKVDTPELREHGLMFRKIPLSEFSTQERSSSTYSDTQSTKSVNNSRKHITKQGMLFDYKKTNIISLWMHNTYIPLDMIFLDEHFNIVSFNRNAVPHSLTSISSNKPVRYAIELNGNSIDALELQIGQNIKDYIRIISKLN